MKRWMLCLLKAHNWNCAWLMIWNVSCLHFLRWSYDSNTKKIKFQGWRESTSRICWVVFGRCAMSRSSKQTLHLRWIFCACFAFPPLTCNIFIVKRFRHFRCRLGSTRIVNPLPRERRLKPRLRSSACEKKSPLWQGRIARIAHLHTFA